MTKIAVKNCQGKKVSELEVSPEVFEVKINEKLLHQVFVSQAVNQRTATAHTKTRGERAGSTKKPWRQKGTGRARTGSVRNPIWRKGGITFGPQKERVFSNKINQKMKVAAIKMALSGKLRDGELVVVDNYDLKNNKTKEFAQILENLELNQRTLIAFEAGQAEKARASRNLLLTANSRVENLNVHDLLNTKFLLITEKGLKFLEEKCQKAESRTGRKKEGESQVSEKEKKEEK
jgi:large subunit ribosomal protein L4